MNHRTLDGATPMITEMVETRLSPEGYSWLCARGAELREGAKSAALSRMFAQVPRFASKAIHNGEMHDVSMAEWTTETLCRIWLLLQVPSGDEKNYVATIDPLFIGAEVNELVALYKALELLQHPEQWIRRCEEGIRSNIGDVLEAIMYNNAFPAAYLTEAAWNQMILKAFFTAKDVTQIQGLKQRINPALKASLADYVQERLAAGRSVHPEIYKLLEV